MRVAENEMMLIYNSGQIQDRETYAYAKSLKSHKLKEIDLQKDSLTETQIKQLSDKMGVCPNELIDTKSTKYLKYFSKADLDQKNTLKVLSQNSSIIKTPILLFHDHAEFVGTPYELIKKDMDTV